MLSSEHLNELVKGGYIQTMPQDPGQGPGTVGHYRYDERKGTVTCSVHGEPPPGPVGSWVAANDPLGTAFGREHTAMEDPIGQVADSIQLTGPITAEALGLPDGTKDASLEQLVAATKHPSAGVRRVAALALRRLRNDHGLPALRQLIRDPDEYVRKQAAWSLGYLGSQDDAALLVPLLTDKAERVRDFAAMALARMKTPAGAVAALAVVQAEDRPPIRRGEAAIALGDGGHRSSVPALRRLLQVGVEHDLEVRLKQALERLGEKT